MLEIAPVQSRKDLKAFVRFPFSLYRDHALWVPPLMFEQMETLNARKNPAFAQAEARLFLARRDGQLVGRVAAIHSRAANLHDRSRNLRFGWFDVVEDFTVAAALFDAVEDWARQLRLDTITGPQGFCDLDPQGLLIEGFEHPPTIATIYNRPYYAQLLERYGFSKDADYVELQLSRESQVGLPPRLLRIVEAVQKRTQVRVLEFRSRREALAWVPQALDVLNEAFEGLYGVVPLSAAQIDYYVKKLLYFLDKDLLVGVVDGENRLQGFAMGMPSLSQAFRRAGGRLLPWGWWHILRGLKKSSVLDFCLVGVRKRYQSQGLNALMMAKLYEKSMASRFVLAESNPILETNKLSLALYEPFHPLYHKRRRVFRKSVTAAQAGEEPIGPGSL